MKVGIIGSGLSGIAAAYFARTRGFDVTLITGKLGGITQTFVKDNWEIDTGPKMLEICPASCILEEMALGLGIEKSFQFSNINPNDRSIYYNGKMIPAQILPDYMTISDLLSNSLLIKNFLANLFKVKKVPKSVDDESIYDFIKKNDAFWDGEDEDWLINVYADANLRALFGGDIKKLSARSCNAYSKDFNLKYNKRLAISPDGYFPDFEKVLVYHYGLTECRKTFLRFKGGWNFFINSVLDWLKKENVKIIDDYVKSIDGVKPQLTLKSGNLLNFNNIISTVNSKVLNSIFPEMISNIEHKSWNSVTLCYNDPPPMKNLGYIIPTNQGSKICSVTYTYNVFPDLAPTISIVGEGSTDELISEFKKHTNFEKNPDYIHEIFMEDAIPQFHIGHYIQQLNMESNRPPWLYIAGHSFYHQGVFIGMIKVKHMIDEIYELSSK
ncbi:hypothetical protein SteCoe_7734 [Stentor coeruleus]|uniref:Amine oxidase domain-containing protein n=1 Tax=Stentor coeruleus TaxID=5963 RepID=A0A1R2CLQ2_9CILI|nr:hypothetical protein SteCoe_7734 [Stentor coeruleus]